MTRLNADQQNAVAHALHIAAERYAENAKQLREGVAIEGLAKQFDRQQAEALALADLINGADAIDVH